MIFYFQQSKLYFPLHFNIIIFYYFLNIACCCCTFQMPMMGPPKPPRVVQPSGPQNNVITNGALMMRTRSEIATRPTGSNNKTLAIETKNQLPATTASITERSIAKAEVRSALQQWQLAQMDSEKNG